MIGEEGALAPKPGTLTVLTKAQRNAAYKDIAAGGNLIEESSFTEVTKKLDPNTPMSKIIELFKDAKAKKPSKKKK